ALARELPGPPTSVRLLRADVAGGELERILAERGFAVERVDVYRTEPADGLAIAAALEAGVDAVALTSASIARAYAAAAPGGRPGRPEHRGPGHRGPPAVFSIGPATSAACAELGITVAAEASPHTVLGLVVAMVAALGSAPTRSL
ncbi:MAG TPA: uroporphyrinogen-III synthase, partial [Acidimicrobiales bacterium]|nr:uroporphyrinogen-III synthase [Acidimicrobiales bacterium]